MSILSAKVKFSDLGLVFTLGDQKMLSLVVTLGAQSRSSKMDLTVLDSDLSITDKVFSWSRKNGGIKIPAELRQSNTTTTTATTGSTTPTNNNTGGTTDGAKLEGLESEIVEVSAYMDTIAWCEGTYPDGYNIMFGGATFSDYSDHPRQVQSGGGYSSDAAGRYQFLSTTWDGVKSSTGVPDFSPKSQNICGWQLAKNRGVTADDIVADPIAALKEAAQEWASLPGSPYGQPTKTEAECRTQYDKVLAERKAKEGTTTATEETEEFNYYGNDFTPTLKAYLDLVANCIGTYERGEAGYSYDPQNDSGLSDLDTYIGRESGRYLINSQAYEKYYTSIESIEEGTQPGIIERLNRSLGVQLEQYALTGVGTRPTNDRTIDPNPSPIPNPEPTGGERNFSTDTQDNIARFILQTVPFTDEDTFTKLSQGDIKETNAGANKYWKQLPGGTDQKMTDDEAQKFFDERLEYWVSVGGQASPGSGTGTLPTVSSGEKVDLYLQTSEKRYRYRFVLVGTQLSNIDVPELTFNCQAAKYGLGIDDVKENYENVTVTELISIIAGKYALPVSGLEDIGNREPIERIDQDGTDQELIDSIGQENDIAVTDDPETGGLKVTDTKKRTRRSIVIPEIISVKFKDIGVVDEEPLYPVSIEAVTTDSMLSIYPEETINLNNLYTFVPESLKRDDWVVNLISHDIVNGTSNLELLKYIPIEVASVTPGTVAGGGTLTMEQVFEKWKGSTVRVGSATGYVLTADGYIGTANHVIEIATDVHFEGDSETYQGEVIMGNAMPGDDVAILKINKTGLIPIPFAPDLSIYENKTDMVCYKIGYAGQVTTSDANESVVREISPQGKDGISGHEVIVFEDGQNAGSDFLNGGDSGGPQFDHWGLLISSTTGGSNSPQVQGPGDYAYSTSINNIRKACDEKGIKYTVGTRGSATASDGTGTGGEGGGPGAVEGWVKPSKGTLTSGFGPRSAPTAGASSNHKGIDVAAGCGADIYAAHSGTVVNDSDDGDGYGNKVIVSNDDGKTSCLYGHCQQVLVKVGDKVSAGQKIALEGTTGTSTGCHLHFGVNLDPTGKNIFSNTFVNPLDYLGENAYSYSYHYEVFGTENFTSVCLGNL